MKNMISLLAVAALAVTFAAGCGSKRPDCAKLAKDDCVKGDEAKIVCVLNADKCEAKKDEVICAEQADKATCDKAAGLLGDEKKTCKFDDKAALPATKCALGDK